MLKLIMSKSSEIPIQSIERQASLPKKILKRVAPYVLAAFTAFSPDKTAVPNPIQETPNPPPLASQKTKESLKQPSSNVLIIDFAPNEPKEGINQTIFPNKDLIESADVPSDVKDFVLHRFGQHGEDVADSMQKIWKRLGFVSTVNLFPLQNAFNTQGIETEQDILGNKEYFLSITPNKLAEILQQHPDQKIVNLSLQMGKIGIARIEKEKRGGSDQLPAGGYIDEYGNLHLFGEGMGVVATKEGLKPLGPNRETIEPISKEEYENLREQKYQESEQIVERETPYIQLKEAYSKEEVQKNLPQLFALCATFPDKLFIAAAGNEGEDLESLPNRPANLLLVAQWNGLSIKPTHEVLGADVYVDNETLGIKPGSSFSTPVIAALGSILANNRLSVEEIKTKIQKSTDLTTFVANDGKEKHVHVFNPDKFNLNFE